MDDGAGVVEGKEADAAIGHKDDAIRKHPALGELMLDTLGCVARVNQFEPPEELKKLPGQSAEGNR